MIDTQLRFKRAASVRSTSGSEPSHVHIVRPSRRQPLDVPDAPDRALPQLTDVGTLEQVDDAA